MCTTVNANALIYWSHSTLLFVENNEYYNKLYQISYHTHHHIP